MARLAARGREDLAAPDALVRAAFDLRYRGQAFELTVPGDERPEPAELRRRFEAEHERRYGYADGQAELELVTVRVAVAEPAVETISREPVVERECGTRSAVFGGRRMEAAVTRGAIGEIAGPALCRLPSSTLLVPPDWNARTDPDGTIELRRHA